MQSRVAWPDLTLRLGAFDEAGNQPKRPGYDLVVPDFGELGEIARFADDHLGDRSDAHLGGDRREARQEQANDVREGEVATLDESADRFDIRCNRVADDCAEKVSFVLEVEIERALRHAGPPGDFI